LLVIANSDLLLDKQNTRIYRFNQYETLSLSTKDIAMLSLIQTSLLWFLALGCGLMAGLYYAFSAFIMTSLSRIAPEAGIATMVSINDVILKTSFMPLFMGTSLASVAIAILAALRWQGPESLIVIVAGLIYFVGMFGVTAAFNVPLNNALVADGAGTWQRYLTVWTTWNHVRTVASLVSSALFIYALAAR
jgi:uncharacterized membrane protein